MRTKPPVVRDRVESQSSDGGVVVKDTPLPREDSYYHKNPGLEDFAAEIVDWK
jgi:hypothetical protein